MTKTGRISNIDVQSQAIKSPSLCTPCFAKESIIQLVSRKICSKCSKGDKLARLTTNLCIFSSFHGWFSKKEVQETTFLESDPKIISTQSLQTLGFFERIDKTFLMAKNSASFESKTPTEPKKIYKNLSLQSRRTPPIAVGPGFPITDPSKFHLNQSYVSFSQWPRRGKES